MIKLNHVEGKKKADIMLYALSTCGWCKKTKNILNQLGVAYDYINVDELSDEEAAKVEEEQVKKWNPAATYPTLVINNKRAEVDFNEGTIEGLSE